MNILTLNTWNVSGPWKERWQVALAWIKKHKPEIVGFQELFDHEWAEEVRRESGYANMVLGESLSGLVWMSDFGLEAGECIQYKAKSPTEDYFRYALYASVNTGAKKIHCFDTHLSWRIEEHETRSEQIDELLAFVDQKAGNEPAVMVGDFNAAPENAEIRKISEKGSFTDAFLKLYPNEKGYTWDNASPYIQQASVKMPDRRIDYLFYRNWAGELGDLKQVSVVMNQPTPAGVYASDHYGVLTQFG